MVRLLCKLDFAIAAGSAKSWSVILHQMFAKNQNSDFLSTKNTGENFPVHARRNSVYVHQRYLCIPEYLMTGR